MIVFTGKGVFGGIAIGKIAVYGKKEQTVKRQRVQDAQAEIARFDQAKALASDQLGTLYHKALHEVGEANAMIFQIHQMMLEDPDYCDSVTNIITQQNVNAEFAVATTADNFAQMFAAMDDAYMKERAADVQDISERVISILGGGQNRSFTSKDPVIVMAEDLAPSETVQLDKDKVLGFVTAKGSTNSHTAILARTMNIPAVISIGAELKPEYDGMIACVDGFTGTVYLNPNEQTLSQMKEKQEQDLQQRALLQQLKGQENVTLDGQSIKLFCNIGNPSDVGAVLKNDAGGIGLFRSEFLYLENSDYPTEEEQFLAYKQVAETMAGKEVVIRTLDIGADKQIDYFDMPAEENPALGYRAIRICLDRTEIFKTQLRALLRASAYGKIAIMFPMITSVEEVQEIKRIVSEVKDELDSQNIPFDNSIQLGIMIETPAAALISDELAKEVDFFSVGTNDLTQYTLAIDRQNQKLERFYNPHHKAVLRLIQMAAENAHKNGIWIGICGELGADLSLTETFLAMGIDELSVSAPYILPLRKKIRETDVSKRKAEILAGLVK